jgi:uncharacterized protein YecT (DUF1311 family)
MNRCACEEAKVAESALQSQYEALLSRHASRPEVRALIQEAQRAYEAFRRAHLTAFKAAAEGSVAPMCACLTASSLARTQQSLVAASPEGDVCAW